MGCSCKCSNGTNDAIVPFRLTSGPPLFPLPRLQIVRKVDNL